MQMAENRTGVIWYGRLDTQPPDLDWGRTNNWKSFATLFTKEWQRLGFQNKKLTKIIFLVFRSLEKIPFKLFL